MGEDFKFNEWEHYYCKWYSESGNIWKGCCYLGEDLKIQYIGDKPRNGEQVFILIEETTDSNLHEDFNNGREAKAYAIRQFIKTWDGELNTILGNLLFEKLHPHLSEKHIGPWKAEVHHEKGREDNDEWTTITDGNDVFRIEQSVLILGDEMVVNLFNYLKVKLWSENPAQIIADHYKDECEKLNNRHPWKEGAPPEDENIYFAYIRRVNFPGLARGMIKFNETNGMWLVFFCRVCTFFQYLRSNCIPF